MSFETIIDKAIHSIDYRQFMKENSFVPTEWNVATLIYNSGVLTYIEKQEYMKQLACITSDDKLKRQLEWELDKQREYLSEFSEDEGNAYYELKTMSNGEYSCIDVFKTYSAAYNQGIKYGEKFKICKNEFEDSNAGGVFGSIYYDADGTIGDNVYLSGQGEYEKVKPWEYEEYFANMPVDLPLCFKAGDIVHVMGTEDYGIVLAPVDEKEEEQMRSFAKTGDQSDFQVPVDVFYDGDEYCSVFHHVHADPTELEYARLDDKDKRKGFLEYMARGKSYAWANRKNRGKSRHEGRIDDVLERIKKVWKQYPDMRLGQLLVCVCGQTDLFYMEDEDLMEKPENNRWGQ